MASQKITKNRIGKRNREFWDYVEETSREVDEYPDWKKGGSKFVESRKKQQAKEMEKKRQ